LDLFSVGIHCGGTFIRAQYTPSEYKEKKAWVSWKVLPGDGTELSSGIQPIWLSQYQPVEFCFFAKRGVCYTVTLDLNSTPNPLFLDLPLYNAIAIIAPVSEIDDGEDDENDGEDDENDDDYVESADNENAPEPDRSEPPQPVSYFDEARFYTDYPISM
jgi:hypothetical protein